VGGIYLFYSDLKLSMKPALAKGGTQAGGIIARSLLRHALWPSSFEDIMTLLTIYDEHVIEFTSYDMSLGTLGDMDGLRNTIIWEVRNY
jgi:hypothetical protein